MAAQYKTLCPHCGAQFKIGVDQLKQARGKVRCGSCLEVFQATQNLIDEAGNPISVGQKKQQNQSGQQARPRGEQGQSAQQSNKRQRRQPSTASPEQPQPEQDKAQQWSLPEDSSASETRDTSNKQDARQDKNPIPSNDTAVSLGDSELSESLLSLDEEGDSWGTDDFGTDAGSGVDKNEAWAEQLLEELEGDDSDTHERKAQKAQTGPPEPDNMSLLDEWADEGEDDEPAGAPQDRSAPPADEADDDSDLFDLGLGDGGEPDFIDLASDAEEAPLPKRTPRQPRSPTARLQWLKWSALSVLALLVLAGQHLAFQYRELARNPDLRPLYAQFCEFAGCNLPPRSSIDQLRGANLVVRSHPRVDEALVVDAIVFNEADYPQPFPDLELTFSSMEEQPLASRRFTPDEYRAGELRDLEHMPSDVPIHVSFEILDPGPDAVNYSLRFHPPARGRG